MTLIPEIAGPQAIQAFTRHQTLSRQKGLVAALRQVEAFAGTLPDPVRAALDAADASGAAVTPRVPVTAPDVHRASVQALTEAALAGRPVDTVKAAKAVTAAERTDTETALSAALAEAVHAAVLARVLSIAAAHGDDLVAAMRPPTMAAYQALDAAVATLPPGVDLDRPLAYGSAVTATLAKITEQTSTVGTFYGIRQALMVARVLPALAVDLGLKWSQVQDMHRHEDDRLLQGHTISDAFLPSRLPERGTLHWWVALSRAGATWWAPSPRQQDARAVEFFDAVRADRVDQLPREAIFN